MIPCDPNREVIDPRKLIEEHGREALAELVARESGYIFQLRPLKDLCLCLKSGMPLLAEGERGGGKTEMVDALAYSCNRPYFELQGMDGLSLHDILFDLALLFRDTDLGQLDRGKKRPAPGSKILTGKLCRRRVLNI